MCLLLTWRPVARRHDAGGARTRGRACARTSAFCQHDVFCGRLDGDLAIVGSLVGVNV